MGLFKSIKRLINPHEVMKRYEVDSFTLFVMDKKELNERWDKDYPNYKITNVNGYVNKDGDILVSWDYFNKDQFGNFIPKKDVLGEELWHKAVGHFHKPPLKDKERRRVK